MVQAPASISLWSDDEWQVHLTRRLSRAVALSLTLHLSVMAVAAWVRLPPHGERPLTSIEISLASLPAVPKKALAPQKKNRPKKVVSPTPTPPVRKSTPQKKSRPKEVSPPTPALPIESAPIPAPVPPPRVPVKPSNDIMRDTMKEVELPPEVPQFGDLSPTEKLKTPQLKLPDVPIASETKESESRLPNIKPQPSLTEDLNKELDEEFKKIRKVELPKPEPPELSLPKPSPQVEAKAPSVKAVNSVLKIPGMAPGSNAYLGRVRQRISSFWTAPPVDVTGQTYVVIVQFRLHRNGSVTGVGIEQSSGNVYYDLAGKRAVLSAMPLPAFPPELTDAHFDAHFTFRVGESEG